jgi:membrane associated rhomboid family serine protease
MTSAPPVCFRHPDRVTRLSCSECGRSICAECSLDAAVGQRCPVCAAPQQRTRVVTARSIKHADLRSTPLTMILIGVNVAIFLIGALIPDFNHTEMRIRFAQWAPAIEAGEWWRGFTAMFLHGSAYHLLFNMWALWLFGPALERRWGTVPFGALYLAAGLGGSALFHALGSPALAVGASGAIFGLFGALLLDSYRRRHTAIGQAIFNQLILLLGINLALPLLVPRIAWEAHVGGLVAGAAIAYAWDRLGSGPRTTVQRTLIALAAAAAALGVLLFL